MHNATTAAPEAVTAGVRPTWEARAREVEMAELELVGIHADGEHLVLTDEEGQRHRLVIDDALRAAVRRDRPQLEQLRSDTLRPREIQALVRAGSSAADIAADAGMPVEQVRRYEGPAVAERAHVAQRAQVMTIGRDAGAPTLGDLVVDRLAGRGVSDIAWDARRRGSEPWEVLARFAAGDRDREATWQVDLTSGTLTALDDESRWLSETDLSTAGPRRHLSAVRPARLYDVETDADIAPALAAIDAVIRDPRPPVEPEPEPAPEPAADEPEGPEATEALLAELSAARGVRQRVETDDDALAAQVLADLEAQPDPPASTRPSPVGGAGTAGSGGDADRAGGARGAEGAHQDSAEPETEDDEPAVPRPHTPALWDDPPAAHPPASRPEEATDAEVLEPRRRGRRSRRTSVPSWDEIVFGAKND